MRPPFRFPVVPAALLALTGALLTGCSSPSPATTTGAPAAENPPQLALPFPFGSKIDSLNGIAGHPFGQPLSAFPALQPLPPTAGDPTRKYAYEGRAGWFGQHQAQVPTQIYYFLDGKFFRFLAVGNPAVLRPEAVYLLGPGQAEGQFRLFWEGRRAQGAYVEQPGGFGRTGTLDVWSKPLAAALASREQARLKAENAQ